MASLVKQLVSCVDDVLPELYRIYRTLRSRDKSPELEDLFQALWATSKALRTSFIVFDALDECETDQRYVVLDFIRRLPTSHFKIFATSRPYLRDIEEYFDQNLQIQIVSQPEDIRTYLNKRMDRERSPALKSEIVETLSVSANGLYADL